MPKKIASEDLIATTREALRLLKEQRAQQAIGLLSPVMPAAQKTPATLVAYAQCLNAIGRHQLAAVSYRTACNLLPSNAALQLELALALKLDGDFEASLKQIKLVRSLQPWLPKAVLVHAELLLDMSQQSDALALMNELENKLGDQSESLPVMARLCSTRCRLVPEHIQPCDILDDVLRFANSEGVQKNQRALLFALAGDLLDKLDRNNEAMWACEQSKKLRAVPWEADRHSKRVACCIQAWSAPQAAELPVSTVDGSGMIFILGMPRSGSSLLEQMISRHPEVYALGERNDISHAAGMVCPPGRGLHPMVTSLSGFTQQRCQNIAARISETIEALRPQGVRYTIDKQPFNFMHIPLIARLFPGCKIIHTQRDLRDVAVSFYMQWFSYPLGQANSFDTIGKYIRDYAQLTRAWQALDAPSRRPEILDVHYEQVVANPEAIMRQVFAYLDLECDPAALDHTKSDRIVATASRDQVKQEIYPNRVHRWKRYERYIGPLEQHAGQYFLD